MACCKACMAIANKRWRKQRRELRGTRLKGLPKVRVIKPAQEEPASSYALYVMRNPLIPGMVKIGKAACPDSRARDLSVAQPFELLVSYTYSGWGSLEIQMHHKLHHIRVTSGKGREWFWLEPEQADMLIRSAILESEIAARAWCNLSDNS